MIDRLDLQVQPATPDRWSDLEALFGARGACASCWCMWWRMKRAEFDRQRGEGTKEALKQLVAAGEPPGLLVYVDGKPVGWCSVGPRSVFSALERSRILKRVDDLPVWSVVCFFVSRPYRNQGLMARLLQEAVAYAAGHGAKIVEGYPVEPKKERMPDIYAYTGTASAFRKAGFSEVARRSETRPIMRFVIQQAH